MIDHQHPPNMPGLQIATPQQKDCTVSYWREYRWFVMAVQFGFIMLKMAGITHQTWLEVFAPTYIGIALVFVVIALMILIESIAHTIRIKKIINKQKESKQ